MWALLASLWLAGLWLAGSGSVALAADGTPPLPLDAARLRERAAEASRQGDPALARRCLIAARGLDPLDPTLGEALRLETERLFARHRDRAFRLLADGRLVSALPELVKATRYRPDDRDVTRILRRQGYRLHGSRWLHRDEIGALERREERLARQRRRGLELADRFQLHRRRRLRIWTDHDDRRLVPFTRRLLDLLEAQELAYLELFAPLEATAPAEGVDVIIFESREEYGRYTKQPDTAGIFLPARSASCFYLPTGLSSEQSEAFVREVFLHEVTHELDDRVLGVRHPPRWLQEGLALQFESARVTADGRVTDLGEVPSAALRSSILRSRPGGAGWWGMRRLVRYSPTAVLEADREWQDRYYAQCWWIARFLLGESVASRRLFFDMFREARTRTEAIRPPGSLVGSRLAAAGVSFDELEERLLRFAGTVAGGEATADVPAPRGRPEIR